MASLSTDSHLMNKNMAFHILDTFLQNGSCEITYTRLAEELSISSNLAKEYLTSYIQDSNPVPNYSLLLELHRHPDLVSCDQDVSIPSVEFKILTNPSLELQDTLLKLKEDQKQIVKRVHVFSVWNKAPSDPTTLWNCEISLRAKKKELTLLPSNTVYHVNPDKTIPLRVQYQSSSDSTISRATSDHYVTPKVVHSPNSPVNKSTSEDTAQTVHTNSLRSNPQPCDRKPCFESHSTKCTVNKTIESQKGFILDSTNHAMLQPKKKTSKGSSSRNTTKASTSSFSPVKTRQEAYLSSPKNDSTHINENGQENELMESAFEQDLWEFNDDNFDTNVSPSKDLTVSSHSKQTLQEKCIKKVKVTVEKQSKQGKYTVVEAVDQIQHFVVDAPLNGEHKPSITPPARVYALYFEQPTILSTRV